MNQNEKLQILQDIIKMPTINDQEEQVANYLKSLFDRYKIPSHTVDYAKNRSSIVAELKAGNGPVLVLSGHMDVVSPGDESTWKYPPFTAFIEGNRLYGRGASDMKAGTAALAIAMMELKEEGAEFKGTLRYLGTVGEEIGELGSQQLTEKGYIDDMDGLLIGEPTGYSIVYTHKGSINYTVTSKGKSSHSSNPDLGINAIEPLITFYQKENEIMKPFEGKSNHALGRLVHSITVLQGGNQVNSVPEQAFIQGNVRTIPETPNDAVIQSLMTLVEEINTSTDCEVSITIDYNKIPVDSNRDSRLIQAARQVVKDKHHIDLKTIGISATTDAAEFSKVNRPFDFMIFGPGIPALAHQKDEYVEIDQYLEMIELYKEIIKNYLI
jgi:succinyl-diaminopimelate desuccinylase